MKPVCVTLVAAWGLFATELKTVSDLQGEHVRYRSLVGIVAESSFEEMALESLGPKDVTLGMFALYDSLQDRVLAGPRGFDHCSYGHWRSVVDSYAKSQSGCPAVKEALKIGNAILVRTVDHNCRRTSRLVQGSDNPLDLAVAGVEVEVLEMSFSRPMGRANEHRIRANVYARTPAVSAEVAKALLLQLRDLTSVGNLGVELRSDPWFITHCGFPAVFPFENRPSVPSLEELAHMPSAGCALFSMHGIIHCDAAPARRDK